MLGGGRSPWGCLRRKKGTMKLHDGRRNKVNQRVLKVWHIASIVLLCSTLVQCSDDGAVPSDSSGYFPLREGSSWDLTRRFYATDWEGTPDTIHFRISGDTIINGLSYKKFLGGDTPVQFLRKQGSRYYVRDVWDGGGFSDEYLFLDEAAPANTTWLLSSYRQYKVVAVNTMKTINGVTYDQVIEMQVNSLDIDGKPYLTANIYYAKGIGEIYGSFPYGLSGAYADMEKSLLKYTP